MMHWIDSPTRLQTMTMWLVCWWWVSLVVPKRLTFLLTLNPNPNVRPFINPKPLHGWPCISHLVCPTPPPPKVLPQRPTFLLTLNAMQDPSETLKPYIVDHGYPIWVLFCFSSPFPPPLPSPPLPFNWIHVHFFSPVPRSLTFLSTLNPKP